MDNVPVRKLCGHSRRSFDFEVSDAAYAEELQSILQNRLDRLRKVAKEYAPAETAKLDPVEVHRVGNYVYMVAGSDYNALMKIMQENIG